mmetsp:Transcript_10829/g.16158  ORF Transcript_10829/g.16158 Transcript_10829/m.16158 type:complete len:326 (+) Transcript_10829:60-1037(+)|eukprot:CAMPEP_0171466108 /NCGR_PEP_ID=MMETSP0945-20130129/8993_1 /TAXON_ID=109269 /ORGANISM="Vaucheria litorea, Strain CCMP2940" /LENGTH=325 /DNA_ID=CAMNT_0011993999 /DNA_START=60 /DNA_END=1037 /DNA_ORIENTATION=+
MKRTIESNGKSDVPKKKIKDDDELKNGNKSEVKETEKNSNIHNQSETLEMKKEGKNMNIDNGENSAHKDEPKIKIDYDKKIENKSENCAKLLSYGYQAASNPFQEAIKKATESNAFGSSSSGFSSSAVGTNAFGSKSGNKFGNEGSILGSAFGSQASDQKPGSIISHPIAIISANHSDEDEKTHNDDESGEANFFSQVKPSDIPGLKDPKELINGEEDENIIFQTRAKLFKLNSSDWVELGVGPLKILEKNKSNRIVMRRELKQGGPGMQLILNIALKGKANITANAVRLVVTGPSKEDTTTYLIRTKLLEDATSLYDFIRNTNM